MLLFLVLFPGAATAAEKIDINTASLKDLQKIIWVGSKIAQQIIDARPFYSLDDLKEKINFIGAKRLADIKEQGLAWVDPNLQPPQEPEPAKEQATSSEPLASTPTPTLAPTTQTIATEEPKLLKIDINTASPPELQKLTSIGQLLAQRIIDARPFYSVDDLARVRGIGAKTLAEIKAQGLAWVDPSLQKPEPERLATSIEKGLAAISQSVKPQYIGQSTKKPISVLLIAFAVAIFSGIIIFTLRQKLKALQWNNH